jgi:hypothetical protein
MLPLSVVERLDRLAPDQRAAATAVPGPVLCIAPIPPVTPTPTLAGR